MPGFAYQTLALFNPRRWACLLVTFTLAAACAPARAQGSGIDSVGTGGRHMIRGRIIFPSGRRASVGLKVRLESTATSGLYVISDANGNFTFGSLRPGSYAIVVEGGDDFEATTERVVIQSESMTSRSGASLPTTSRPYTVQVYLQPKRRAAEMARPGVLNAALASVPKPAAELYEKAVAAARGGDYKKAVGHLKGALAAHPEFALALSELGVLYMKMKQPEKAAGPLADALKLKPDDYAALITYGIALYDLQKFSESEEQFRKALARNNASPSAHFYVGLLLLRRRDYDGAEKSFASAVEHGGQEMALAHYYLGGIHWGRKDYRRAAEALETYLRLAPEAENAGRVRATVKELRAKL